MKALAICHETKNDLGTLQDILQSRGFDIALHMASEDILPTINPDDHDLAIIMGGHMGVYEADDYPHLHNEIAYIGQRLAADLPTLGVCLGGQLMAKSLGANVYKGTNGKETGWREIHVTEAGQQTALQYLDAAHTKMTQGHQDTFDLPEGATLLATSSQYQNQAFSYGEKALGLQFHPELTKDILGRWLDDPDGLLLKDGITREKIEQDTAQYMPRLEKQTEMFFNAWLDRVL
jgi:GMP synthase (glutamine-hydrolysing)